MNSNYVIAVMILLASCIFLSEHAESRAITYNKRFKNF